MAYNFALALNDASRLRGEKVYAYTADGAEHTYRSLNARAAAAAQVLSSYGITVGSRVALRLPNTIDFVAYYFAVLSLGGIVFLINPGASQREVEYIVTDGALDAIIVLNDDSLRDDAPTQLLVLSEMVNEESSSVETLQPVLLPDDATALVLYTSGSTGSPKGVELTHMALLLAPLVNAVSVGFSGASVMYGVLPFYHIYGLSELVNAAVVRGDSIVLREKYSTEDLINAIEKHRITSIPGVPTIFHAVINSDLGGRDLSSVEEVASGGAPISAEHIQQIRQSFPNARYVEGYGLTETGALGTQNGYPFEFRHGSVGRAGLGLEIAIVDANDQRLPPGAEHTGEIVVRGVGLMKGYLGRPEETARTIRDNWIYTGDIGWLDDDGYLYIAGRTKELIIRGGYNVYPVEIEHVLEAHPLVSSAAVVGRPDDHYGEEIVAFIVLRDPSTDIDAAVILDDVRESLSAYKIPRVVIFKQELPKGPTGKINKRELAEEAVRSA